MAGLALHCAGSELPAPPTSPVPFVLAKPASPLARLPTPLSQQPAVDAGSNDSAPGATPLELVDAGPVAADAAAALPPGEADHCAGVPPLGPDGAVPPPPPHVPLGQDLSVPGDRPVYVLPGNGADPRLIVYLHGMCGDTTAADHFREAVRAHGTLVALRGDTPCAGDRFKWRNDPSKIQARLRAAVQRVRAHYKLELTLEGALLFGYSQGADRAEKLAGRYPQQYRRIVLGGAPMRASPDKLAGARRVAFLGGELETTDTMRAGYDALSAAGVACRFFTLACAYHGYYGTSAEAQLSEVLDWVSE